MAIDVINRAQVPLRAMEGHLGSYQAGTVNEGSWRRLAGHPKVDKWETWRAKIQGEPLPDLQAEAQRAGIDLVDTHGDPCAFAQDREALAQVLELYARAEERDPIEASAGTLYSEAKALEDDADFAPPSRRPDVLSWYIDVFGDRDAVPAPEEANDE